MATFRSPAYQATHVMQQMQGTALRSVGTVRNYEQALNRVAEWAQRQRLDGGLRAMTPVTWKNAGRRLVRKRSTWSARGCRR